MEGRKEKGKEGEKEGRSAECEGISIPLVNNFSLHPQLRFRVVPVPNLDEEEGNANNCSYDTMS